MSQYGPSASAPSSWLSFRRGLMGRCPRCGEGRLFSRFLKLSPPCDSCGLDYEPHRADDAPAYFTILVVGHVVVPLVLMLEQLARPPLWLHGAIFLPLAVVTALVSLPFIKGAVVAVNWTAGIRTDDPR